MAQHKLGLTTLKDLDLGKVETAFRLELQRVIEDLQARPEDKKERALTLKVSVLPEEIDRGQLETVKVVFQVAVRLPAPRSRDYSMLVSTDALTFNADSLDDAKQQTFTDSQEDERRAG